MAREAGDESFLAWFMQDTHWSRTGVPLAAGLLLLAPLVRRGVTRSTLLAYLQLPVYMLHQYEEHGHGAFKRDVNALVPPTVGHLTDGAIFWINILGVWGVDGLATALAATSRPGAGLLAPYLAVANAAIHVGVALKQRRYNPGLGTALALFLPFGAYSIRAIGRDTAATPRAHLRALGLALGLHGIAVALILAGRNPTRA
ncbi:MAG TPA: HXXEE domain-containing protein [Thermomicrobiales bacterium]|nr:HXXEE domain-containing protein [Thermomicrobiales bacterium]